MNIILTSGPAFSLKKENGTRKALKLENIELVEQIKKNVTRYKDLLFVCSDPDAYEKSESYKEIIEKSLSLSGVKFDFSDLLDSRNALFTRSLVKNSDLIVLLGGDPITQMDFFNSIEFKEKLKGYEGCLLGISAGSINLAKKSYCSQDEDVEKSIFYKGLGLVDLTIEPHFDINDKERLENVLLKDSEQHSFIALPNESFIVVNDDIKVYGDAYYFSEGNYKKITKEMLKVNRE